MVRPSVHWQHAFLKPPLSCSFMFPNSYHRPWSRKASNSNLCYQQLHGDEIGRVVCLVKQLLNSCWIKTHRDTEESSVCFLHLCAQCFLTQSNSFIPELFGLSADLHALYAGLLGVFYVKFNLLLKKHPIILGLYKGSMLSSYSP